MLPEKTLEKNLEKTEREKMLAGDLYLAANNELTKMHMAARQLLHAHNFSLPDEIDQRKAIMGSLFGEIGSNFVIRPPFYCDYGCYIFAGDRLFINYDCTILDCNTVHIGNDVLIGTKVQIYTAYHPTDPEIRLTGEEYSGSQKLDRRLSSEILK